MLPVVILAGGIASRLYPITKKIPKSLININGKPFIHHQLKLLRQKHVKDVIICLGTFGERIETFVGNGLWWDLNVRYSHDGSPLLGTGGAVKNALHLLPDVFFVMYGDSYLDIDLTELEKKYHTEKKSILMTVYRNDNKNDKSNILVKDSKIISYDKVNPTKEMKHIDYGISIVHKSVFDSYNGVFDLATVFHDYIKKDQVSCFETITPFFEIGSFKGIERLKQHIGDKNDRDSSIFSTNS